MSDNNFPPELRALPQWVSWEYRERDGNPTKPPVNPHNGKTASVNDHSTWGTIEEVAAYNCNRGFVFVKDQGYTFIDLDYPYKTDPQGNYRYADPANEEKRFNQIIEAFSDSYTEISPSGKGAHIIVRGSVPKGIRSGCVEVYSQQRYATMTGNIYEGRSTIVDAQDRLNVLFEQMSKSLDTPTLDLAADVEQSKEDAACLDQIRNFSNVALFDQLWAGDWQSLYSSQSEADLVLMDFIAVVTQNHDQMARLFRASALGQRLKAQRYNYVYGQLIRKALDRALPKAVDLTAFAEAWRSGATEADGDTIAAPESVTEPESDEPPSQPLGDEQNAAFAYLEQLGADFKYVPPPGLIGDIARFIYAQAPQPIMEIALTGAFGMLAGITGRAYNVSRRGLNIYIMVLAGTGVGKEAMAEGIDAIMREVCIKVPTASEFIGPADYASPQAFMRNLPDQPIYFSLIGEFGIRLKQICNPDAKPNESGLMRSLLDTYGKSGKGRSIKPQAYADVAKTIGIAHEPAPTLIGESVPTLFYDAIDEGTISTGLIPRFTIIEYAGDIPPFNHKRDEATPSYKLVEDISSIAAFCLGYNPSMMTPVQVVDAPDAKILLNAFREYCRITSNSTRWEVEKNLFTRASMKAHKLAALIAIGIDRVTPVITLEFMQYAIGLTIHEVKAVMDHFNSGTVGSNTLSSIERAQIKDIAEIIHKWFSNTYTTTYGGSLQMHQNLCIPYQTIQRQTMTKASLKKGNKPPKENLKATLIELENMGLLETIQGKEDYKFTGKMYQVKDIDTLKTMAKGKI